MAHIKNRELPNIDQAGLSARPGPRLGPDTAQTDVVCDEAIDQTAGYVILFSQNIIRKVVKMQAYCMKCRKKVEIKNPKSITMKNKKAATQGVCPNCGTKVFRIGK